MQKRKKIRFLTVNDVYSFNEVDGHGGWARAVSLLRELRDELPKVDYQVVVACGDILGGSALLNYTKGELAIDITNLLPFDAIVVGNHEFDYGPEALQKCIEKSKSNWFGSNIKENGKLLPQLTESQVVELEDGIRIGLFGLCTSSTPYLSDSGPNIHFEDPIATAKRIVPEMNAHINVALTHLSLRQDKELAEALPELNLILGGHDHDPIAVIEHKTLLLKTGMNCYHIGIVELDISYCVEQSGVEKINVFSSWEMKSTALTSPDKECLALVQAQQRLSDASMMKMEGGLGGRDPEEIVAELLQSSRPLDTRSSRVRSRNSTSGNLVADALRWYHPESDLAIINGGFIRGDRLYPPGTSISLRHILSELPFPRTSATIRILGKHLWEGLEQQLQHYPRPSGGFPHLSENCRLLFNMNASKKAKIHLLTINGTPVDHDRLYNVTLTDFMAKGGDACSAWGYGRLLDANPDHPYKRIALVLLDYLAHNRHLELTTPDRVVEESN